MTLRPAHKRTLKSQEKASILFSICNSNSFTLGDRIHTPEITMNSNIKLLASANNIHANRNDNTLQITIPVMNTCTHELALPPTMLLPEIINLDKACTFQTTIPENILSQKIDNDKINEVNQYIAKPASLSTNKKLSFAENLSEERQTPDLNLPDHYAENHMGQRETILCDDSTNANYAKIKLNHLNNKARHDFQAILDDYSAAFAKHKNDIGLCTLIKHDIVIKDVPMSQNQRFLPPDKQSFAQKQVDILCKNNIVSIDPQPLCVSNLLLIPKFSGIRDNTKAAKLLNDTSKIDSFRLVQDLRLLNKNTLSVERTNKVCLDDFIKNLNNKVVSTLDILSAYYHIELTDRAKKLTAFYLGNKTYVWRRMTQGLISAAST